MPPGGWEQPIGQAPHVFAGAELSGWWRRVGAQIIDSLILTVPVVLIVILVVVVAAGSDVGAVVTGDRLLARLRRGGDLLRAAC